MEKKIYRSSYRRLTLETKRRASSMKFKKALDNVDRSLLQNMGVILSGPTVIKFVRVHRVRSTRDDFSANFGNFFRCGHSGRSAIVVAQNMLDPIQRQR